MNIVMQKHNYEVNIHVSVPEWFKFNFDFPSSTKRHWQYVDGVIEFAVDIWHTQHVVKKSLPCVH